MGLDQRSKFPTAKRQSSTCLIYSKTDWCVELQVQSTLSEAETANIIMERMPVNNN